MILDKLMEKKDLRNYIGLRIEYLNENFDVEKYPDKEREIQKRRHDGRILELKQLLKLLSRCEIVSESKRMCKEMKR